MTWVPRSFQRRMALARDGASCRYCGRRVWPKHVVPKSVFLDCGMTFDHYFPRVRSGPSEVWNLFISCYRCNSTKRDVEPEKLKGWRLLPTPEDPLPIIPWHAGIRLEPWVCPAVEPGEDSRPPKEKVLPGAELLAKWEQPP